MLYSPIRASDKLVIPNRTVADNNKNGLRPGSSRRQIINAGRALNLVATFVGAVFAGFFGGFFLDRWLHTTPWLTMTLCFVGIATGVYMVWREARRLIP